MTVSDLQGVLSSPVSSIMTRQPTFVDAELTVRQSAEAMALRGIGSLIVLRVDGPSAIVTERDVVAAVADGSDPDHTWAVDIAAEHLTTLRPDDTIGQAIDLMASCCVHHLPVKEYGEAVGMVSAGDILAALSAGTSASEPDIGG